MGLGRLQQVLHELSPAFRAEVEPREHGRRVLLVPVPGEQHSFGLLHGGRVLPPRRLGRVERAARHLAAPTWSSSCAASGSPWSACRSARETRIDALATGIRAIRRASRNRAIGVLVGGPLFIAHPELVARVGADATAIDGGQAAAPGAESAGSARRVAADRPRRPDAVTPARWV